MGQYDYVSCKEETGIKKKCFKKILYVNVMIQFLEAIKITCKGNTFLDGELPFVLQFLRLLCLEKFLTSKM